MSLETGLYFIQAKSTHYNVGRYYVEDRSLLPKRVLSLSQAVGGLPSEWLVEKTGDRTYRMKAQDTYTGVIDDKLYAFLLPEPAPVDWVIKAHPEHGDNVYRAVLKLRAAKAGLSRVNQNPRSALINSYKAPDQLPVRETNEQARLRSTHSKTLPINFLHWYRVKLENPHELAVMRPCQDQQNPA
ncbi:hypothetical protein TWF703_010904 [Orbilia oligospora]|uniref:Uncharacterized protein n=1 Tax=Orbilia oligospora TaxID=2813651 RepID=A0A7C8NQ50_ORBOL|nr:hypothetical protein TWF703_010904 [Orbilia oligospora]